MIPSRGTGSRNIGGGNASMQGDVAASFAAATSSVGQTLMYARNTTTELFSQAASVTQGNLAIKANPADELRARPASAATRARTAASAATSRSCATAPASSATPAEARVGAAEDRR